MRAKLLLVVVLPFATIHAVAFAEDASKPVAEPSAQAAWDAASKVAKQGPADAPLMDQAVFHVPAEMAFIPKAEANGLLVAWGNQADDRLIGMVVPKSNDENWAVTIDQINEGYVKDDEARNWNADELLQSLKDGTEAGNKDRLDKGFKALDVIGWIEKPNYESATHRLIWSMQMARRGADTSEPKVVNYNTYALGRDGYLEIDLLTDDVGVEKDKTAARAILAAVEYNKGKRYEDYLPSTDHLAEYGIAALIGGVAAKKLGLLALASVFVLKFIKVIGIAVIVGLGALKRFFTGRKTPSA
jgi:uncharacterized membrane-anchored protein